jgi:hypothetical protein
MDIVHSFFTFSFRKLHKRWFFSEKTHGMLNYATLTIADKQIDAEYNNARTQNFDDSFRYMVLVSVLNLLFRVGQVIIDDRIPPVRIFYAM